MQDQLVTSFESSFAPARATHIVRAPGRVNLIGEHTDYNGLPVFPMAIQRAVTIVMRARADGRVRLVNREPCFAPREFEIVDRIEPFENGASGDWGNYAKAAASILRERTGITRGFDGFVSGDIPPAAGLSSSSAMVVACALALVQANASGLSREELMELTAQGERFVGVQSGGMDQAICLGGIEGHALVIDFDPIRLRPTPVPEGWRFLIADSHVRAEKAGRARAAYNARVVECRTALERVSAHPRAASWPRTWRGLVERIDMRELLDVGALALDGIHARRFRHVVTEGARVELARQAMLAADRVRFGELMNASHSSLRDDYDVSCAELDRIVAIARDAGAAGARLTGAGFGGCVVALCGADEAEKIVRALDERFYRGRSITSRESILTAEPSRGATCTPLESSSFD